MHLALTGMIKNQINLKSKQSENLLFIWFKIIFLLTTIMIRLIQLMEANFVNLVQFVFKSFFLFLPIFYSFKKANFI